jgi:hypothetical protein
MLWSVGLFLRNVMLHEALAQECKRIRTACASLCMDAIFFAFAIWT